MKPDAMRPSEHIAELYQRVRTMEKLISEAEIGALECPCDGGCNHCFVYRSFLELAKQA